jgi:hypothetical protein
MDPEEVQICQSCGMPMVDPEDFGSNADGSPSRDYCRHCWQEGKFTTTVSFDEFVEIQVQIAVQNLGMDEDEAREVALTTLPELKRWQVK